MTDWQDVRDQIRRSDGGACDLRPYWRAEAYAAHSEEPETVVRAHAFENVLRHAHPFFYEGESIAGSMRSFTVEGLPDGVGVDALTSAREREAQRGQRDFLAGFDHTLADYPTLLDIGINGYIERTRASLQAHRGRKEEAFLRSVELVLKAFRSFISLYARQAEGRSWALSECLEAVAGPAPRTFRQAVQLVWMTHVVFSSEGRHHMALGRIDQYLYPFYKKDMADGALIREDALDVICQLWVRLEETGGIQNICVGGLTPEGLDATNALSYLLLEATRRVQSAFTNLSARFHDATPKRFHRACFDVIRTGIGFPAIFNDHVTIPGLERVGIPLVIARDYCMVGCIETMLAGRQQAWSDSRLNMPLCLTDAMRRLKDLPEPSYEDLERYFRESIEDTVRTHVAKVNAHFERYAPDRFPDPFLSALTQDCIARGKDINGGGALFARFHGVAFIGLATTANSLAAVKRWVFDSEEIAYDALMQALEDDFNGHEVLRCILLNKTPKYGNDTAYVDGIAAQVVEWVSTVCLQHSTSDSGRFVPLMAANVQNISAGKETGATPDGRRALTPLSDAASPYFGSDRQGPTAFLRSVAVPDYKGIPGGTVINMRFDPEQFTNDAGRERFAAFTEFFVKERIAQLQFNFTSNETLRAAQEHPEAHGDLIVRVSGFSAHFTTLDHEVQEDVIRRNAHG